MKQYFKDKKITVMGLGLLGRGIGDALYLASSGAEEVIVTDLKTETQLMSSVEKLRGYENVRLVLGRHNKSDFIDVDLILVAGGVPFDSPYLSAAREAGVEIAQSAALFARIADIPIIGVTGTRGKSTVTHMIHHVLEMITGEKVLLGGNIRGVSNLELLNYVHQDSLCVMELDSWQLQGWGWFQMSPDIAVFTNFMPDHLNYYKRDDLSYDEALKKYFADKANIFRYQNESDVFITTPKVFDKIKDYTHESGNTLGQEVVLVDESEFPDETLLMVPGNHNKLNAVLAYKALKALSLQDEEIFPALSTFRGVEGRLQYLGLISSLEVYNDNNATTPQATIVGLEAVGNENKKNVILIAGGSFKDIDPSPLVESVKKFCKKIILLPGTGTDIFLGILEKSDFSNDNYEISSHLSEAVAKAFEYGNFGDVLLFSPGFASFGSFNNEYDRNDQFIQIITSYQDT